MLKDLGQKEMSCTALLSKLPYKPAEGLAPHPSSIATPTLHSLLSVSLLHPRGLGLSVAPPAQPSCLGKCTGIPVPGGAWASQGLGRSSWGFGQDGRESTELGRANILPATHHTWRNGETPPRQLCRGLQGRVVLKEHQISPSSSSLQVWQ